MSNASDPIVNFDVDTEVVRPDDEGLFARDVDGQLIRVEKATADELEKTVTLKIDGVEVNVNQAVPECDAQGNIKQDEEGKPIPRPTTIYDAAYKAFVKKPGQQHPIPALCHREHLPPVGVCRVCVVELLEEGRDGSIRSKLVPSCKQAVKDGMIVHTINSNDAKAATRVKNASRTVVELLMADHRPPEGKETLGNELTKIAKRLSADEKRFSPLPVQRGHDSSSHMIDVDHDQCILCGRCQRGCNWIKGNNVIGRGGKGYQSRIVFDLDNTMEESTCVSCGECAVSCPTGALEFQKKFIDAQVKRVEDELKHERKDGDIVKADELIKYDLFKDIPYKFLQFNGAAVVRRKLQPDNELCRQGEYGATAFIILEGEFEIKFDVERGKLKNKRSGGWFGKWFGRIDTVREDAGSRKPTLGDVGEVRYESGKPMLRDASDVILGEMTCMNRGVRSATVVATKPSHVLEIRRNVLYMLQRNQVSREILDRLYRQRALQGQLSSLPLFDSLDDQLKEQAAKFLTDKASYSLVDPAQPIFKQGEVADAYYVIKLGSVKVTQSYGQNERVLNYLGPGSGFGEIGLLSGIDDQLDTQIGGEANRGRRTATCSALDHVELYRIDGSDFRDLLQQYPQIRSEMVGAARKILEKDREAQSRLQVIEADSFLEQGLYMAQSLLVLDLERCTRCDECTKACADAHDDGVTRLVREGLRFDKYLVASSCRSCLDPLCLVGCPVDAIHRDGDSKEIEIEDYCIGCGLCANQCPYGNINMHGFPVKNGGPKAVVQQRATTCDLCRDAGGPSCVHACPHEAAFRMTGEELKSLVSR